MMDYDGSTCFVLSAKIDATHAEELSVPTSPITEE